MLFFKNNINLFVGIEMAIKRCIFIKEILKPMLNEKKVRTKMELKNKIK